MCFKYPHSGATSKDMLDKLSQRLTVYLKRFYLPKFDPDKILFVDSVSVSKGINLAAALHRHHAGSGPRALQRLTGRRCKYLSYLTNS